MSKDDITCSSSSRVYYSDIVVTKINCDDTTMQTQKFTANKRLDKIFNRFTAKTF